VATPGTIKRGRPKGTKDAVPRKSRKGHAGQKFQTKSVNGEKPMGTQQGGRSGSGSNTSKYTTPGYSHKTLGVEGVNELLEHIKRQNPEAAGATVKRVCDLLKSVSLELGAEAETESTGVAAAAAAPAVRTRAKGAGRKRQAAQDHTEAYRSKQGLTPFRFPSSK